MTKGTMYPILFHTRWQDLRAPCKRGLLESDKPPPTDLLYVGSFKPHTLDRKGPVCNPIFYSIFKAKV